MQIGRAVIDDQKTRPAEAILHADNRGSTLRFAQQPQYANAQDIEIRRLSDIIVRAAGETLHLSRITVLGCKHQDRNRPRIYVQTNRLAEGITSMPGRR